VGVPTFQPLRVHLTATLLAVPGETAQNFLFHCSSSLELCHISRTLLLWNLPLAIFQQFSSRPSERRQVALCVFFFFFFSLEYSPFCFIDTFLVFSYGTVTLPVSRVTENLNILLAMLFSTFCTSLMVWVARILDEPTLCPCPIYLSPPSLHILSLYLCWFFGLCTEECSSPKTVALVASILR